MDDKTIAWDCLKDEKFLVGMYSQISTEIANQNLLNDTNQNGWYPLTMADQQALTQAATKAQQLSSSVQ